MALTFGDLAKAIDDANVRVVKAPGRRLPNNGDSPRGALLDALNKLLAEKEGTNG